MKILSIALSLLGIVHAQSSNNTPLNNGGDVVYFYASPSSGFSALAFPPDITGDLYWRSHSGANMMNDVDRLLGAAMEIDGYYEYLFDTHWATSPSFYVRSHGPALLGVNGNLEPAFFQLGLTTEIIVLVGASGFGNPCSITPTLCSPSGGSCPVSGFVNGYLVDLGLSATPGTGIVLPADGTTASDMATTYFVTGGMTATGGPCGVGDYDMQDHHSIDETQADLLGNGTNPNGGLQVLGSGPIPESIGSMASGHATWRGNVVSIVADSGGGLGAEVGSNGGGAMNGRNLSVGGGGATLGVELRDREAVGGPNLGIVGASLAPFPGGLSVLGGTLLVLPDGLFRATSGIWQGPVVAATFTFTSEGAFQGAQLPIPPAAAGATLHVQGAVLALTGSLVLDSTNAVSTNLLP